MTDQKKFFIKHKILLLCIVLMTATFAVFCQTLSHDFVNFDDNLYVYENRHIQNGLKVDNIIWAFTSTHAGNWHPLTWISHMVDCQLYGLNPGWHHLTNLLLHMANTLLLFFVFREMTENLWQSWFVAALFALHPLHVESVAWVAERKDLICTFFWILTMWSYVRYVEHPKTNRYLLVLVFFIMGLMSKPMIVTLPFVLLLLDFYPLSRVQFQHFAGRGHSHQRWIFRRMVLEKLPLFVLATISSVITVYAQEQVGALKSFDRLPFIMRIANALVSYVKYIGKMIYPSKLAVLYPYPKILSWWEVTGACVFLVSMTFLAIRMIKRRPYFAVGWFWYIGTLVPVVGLVQVGGQSMADRYTYIPIIGLFIIIAWGVPDLLRRWRYNKNFHAIFATVLIPTLMIVTWKQLGHWKNSITLFEHALEVTSNNSTAHNSLGYALSRNGHTNEATKHFLKALEIRPHYEKPHLNLGYVLYEKGHTNEAISHFLKALEIKPHYEKTHFNLGIAFYHNGNINRAMEHFQEVIEINPHNTTAKNYLKKILTLQKQNQ